MLYNIAIIPPKSLSESAIAMSKTLSTLGAYFTLDGVNYHPHLTLYLTDFPEHQLGTISDTLEAMVSNLGSLKLTADKFYMNDSDYIDISYINGPKIAEIHETILSKLGALRITTYVDPALFKGKQADEMYFNARDTGYAIGRKLYRPHITLTKQTLRDEAAMSLITWQNFDFTATTIGLFEADSLGCCRKLLRQFTMSAKT